MVRVSVVKGQADRKALSGGDLGSRRWSANGKVGELGLEGHEDPGNGDSGPDLILPTMNGQDNNQDSDNMASGFS